jgi:hypothetical protein
MLTLLRAATEDEMIMTFVRAELESPRFGAELHSTLAELGLSVEVISAAPSVAGANEARRQLLAAYRGWGQYESVFGGMPDDVVWSWVELDESVLRAQVFTIEWYFEEAFGTRSVNEIGEMKRGSGDASRLQLEQSVAEGRALEPPILLAEPDLRRLVILEGHSRILSYLANPDLVTFPILSMVGTSARVAEWSEW